MARFDPNIYMDTYGDVEKAYQAMRRSGQLQPGTGVYYDTYGKNLNEAAWVKILNESTNKNLKDVRGFTKEEFAKAHYDKYGKKEKRTGNKEYRTAFRNAPEQRANQDDYFNVDRFNQLLGKLEASKGRQVRQKAVEGRRDTWAAGLAGMMGNF